MIYFIILVLLIFCSYKFDFTGSKKGEDFWYNVLLIVLIGLAGLRYKVGGDTLTYLREFGYIPVLRELNLVDLFNYKYNLGWLLFSSASKSIVDDFCFFQILHAIFFNIVLFKFFRRYTSFKFTAVLIYYLFGFLYFNMEVMRETIAIAFFLMAYPFFLGEKWGRYYLLAIIGILFHSSALILMFLPIFRNMKPRISNILFLMVVCPVVFFILNYTSIFSNALVVLDLQEKYEFYSNYRANINGMIGNFLMYVVFPFMILKFSNSLRYLKKFRELILVYFCLSLMYVAVSGFGRFLNYMTPFMVIYFADLLNEIYRSKRWRPIRQPMIITFFFLAFIPKIFYYTMDTSHIVADTYRFHTWYPYSSIFQKKEYRTREILHTEGLRLDRER